MNLSKEKIRAYIWINRQSDPSQKNDTSIVFNYPVKLIVSDYVNSHEITTREGDLITVRNWDICRVVYRKEGDEPIEDKKVPEKLIVSP